MFPDLGFLQNPVDEDDVGMLTSSSLRKFARICLESVFEDDVDMLTSSSLRWYVGDFLSIGMPEQVGMTAMQAGHDNHAIRASQPCRSGMTGAPSCMRGKPTSLSSGCLGLFSTR